mmetsp:Transcript_21887/g.60847  ORF Transcript_21887/g.60847 Transcript_21887/m.60847 type:complete len:203 (+) Transcript_21887:145-753(+)|eukprot:CAMPEP_0168754032 /NCGR_PEP_ID=MMETSP0724-20121128/19282_1 /TAXON_ID=265536 /ORGANISM="Amphiprora sp., Strain CCMP467" /LENGTH=202 /DNA_ID=CAMNT_0008802479 /DNA_START=86 /DNA_END=694 /DNA_ORIENTATION=-
MKIAFALLATGATAFSPVSVQTGSSTALFNGPVIGAGGMADTRDPDALQHEDPRKSISDAPSFEEYLKQRSGAPAEPAAAAPAAAAPAAAAPAAPAAPAPAAKVGAAGEYGIYDEQLWDMEAKQVVYAAWDPNSPRSPVNFNPFETFEGNSPDASGFYPGEGRYKDPARPDVSFASMQAERVILDDIAANPKAAKGCPGCKN